MTDQERDRPDHVLEVDPSGRHAGEHVLEVDAPAPAAPLPTPAAEMRRRLPRPAPESEIKAYIPPAPLPENQDDARRTQELSRIQISPELDPRRRATVRRAAPVDEVTPPVDASPGLDAELGSERRAGPRGTVLLNPRARGGTKMMIAGVAESAALPPRARSSEPDEAPAGVANPLRILVLGAVVVLGLATLALLAARGIGSSPIGTSPRSTPMPSASPPEPESAALPPPVPSAPVEVAPSVAPAEDAPPDEPSATSAAPVKRGRGRAKPPAKSAPAATSAKPRAPSPMFERPEGH